jgi:uncharacterized damage-inducible protein DinB
MSTFFSQNDAIADELRRAHFGDAWHGPAVAELVHGLEAVEAAAHPVADSHSIWEIVLHVTAWRQEVARRLAPPEAGDWPRVPAVGEAAWGAAVAALAAATEAVIAAVAAFPEARLAEQAGDVRDAALGSGLTWGAMLHGLAQHDAYHGGQILILKRALAVRDGK